MQSHRRIASTSSISSLSVGASMSTRGSTVRLRSGDFLTLWKALAPQTFGASWRS